MGFCFICKRIEATEIKMRNLDNKEQIIEKASPWMQAPYDAQTQAQVREWVEGKQWEQLTEAFYKDLEFGTGGLRGIMGIGTNRINRYTLGKATQGFSNYLKQVYPGEEIRVAVSYDSRNHSQEFARMVAEVFSANTIQVYFFESLHPTPLLSYAIRSLNCHAGVMITASHNPKVYNGYKAYWKDGGQLVAPHDQGVMDAVQQIQDPSKMKYTANETFIHPIGADLDTQYIQSIHALSLHPELVREHADMPIVFSPIHGTGLPLVEKVLKTWGFQQVHIVQAQAEPNGDFPTVVYPNPEEAEAMSLALAEAEKQGADVVMATDPDADRVGVAVRDGAGKLQMLNGNQIACLLVDYVLKSRAEKGLTDPSDYVVKTIVTSALIDVLCSRYNTPCYNVLTGFKYIGELITQKEGEARFIVGGEESYGYLIGDLVRDKDAVVSCAFISEMAAYYRNQGKSLYDALITLYLEHGLFKESLLALNREGKSGLEEIQEMMRRLRTHPPKDLAGIEIVEIRDYQQGLIRHLSEDRESPIHLPQSNVLQFVTAQGDVLSVRPSGTEPKIKFYCSAQTPLDTATEFEAKQQGLDAKISAMMQSVLKAGGIQE